MTLFQRTALVLVLFLAAACGDAENATLEAADSPSADSAAAQDASAAALRGTPAAVPDSTAPRADSARMGVSNFKYSQLPDGTRIFTGALQNNTGEAIDAAQVQISLLDADNRRLSTVNIEVYDIPANGTKEFRQPLDSDDQNIKGARVRSVFLP